MNNKVSELNNCPHSIESTEILFLFTNTPCPRLQKKIKIASTCCKTTVIYWRRSNYSFETGLKKKALEIPLEGSFFSGRGIWRILSFFTFLWKALPFLSHVKKVKKVYVDYFDVLIFACLFFRNLSIDIIYEVGDLISLQYGGHPFITYFFSQIEKSFLKRVSVLILPSPYFWSEYYQKIFAGKWMLVENLPEYCIWNDYVQKQPNGQLVVGYIGSIRYLEQIRSLLEVVRGMREKGHQIRILFAGTGPDEQKVMSEASGLDYISFLGPYEYDRDAPSIYSKVDIVFSVYDTTIANVKIALPNRLYESIICGLPIVVAKGTCLEKYIMKYGIGYSVDCSSITELNDALTSYVTGDSQAIQIKEMLNSIDKSAFFYDRYTSDLVQLFKI